MSGALPPGWRQGTLADVIASISAGVSVNGEDRPMREGEVGVLKITAVLHGVFEPEHHKAVVGPERIRLATRVSAGTVLVSRGNGNPNFVGAAALVAESYPNLFLPDLLWQITPSQNASPEWLSLVLGSSLMRPHIARIAVSTSTLKKISQSQYLTLPILIPPREEQDRIVEIVQTWDRGIAIAREARQARWNQTKALTTRLFAHAGATRRLGDLLAEPLAYGANAPACDYDSSLPRYLRVTDLDGRGGLSSDDLKGVSIDAPDLYLEDGDLVFARTGAVGHTYLHDGSFDAVFAGYLIRARTDRSILLPGYLAAFAMTQGYWQWIARTTRRGAQPNINASEYAELPVPVCPLARQHAILEFAGDARKMLELTESKLLALVRERRVLAAALLSGQTLVNAKTAEPAHA